ncbi:MAG: hypothetical protein A3F17_08775 [Gammaproteobacteria bacterium RIFCSPHIGHO2_12_FULL_41_15]|nr:MAG: hypothetical protein A3F17_08775 [Gammaproteobacteria bacterium RIFCSPHIGHO2_12_FULL_41_15]
MSYQRVNDVSDELISAVKELPFIRTHLFNALNPPKQNVVILKGARGVGKSTLLLQFLLKKKQENIKVLYLSADSTLLHTSLVEFAHE